MHIVLLVTANTSCGCTSIDIIDMTLLARHLGMLTSELERRQIMIKDFSIPTLGVVTARTVHTKVRRVRVILLVTAHAIGWSVFETDQTPNAHMAVHATDISVLAE